MKTPEDLARWLIELGFSDFALALTEEDLMITRSVREAIQRAGEALVGNQPFDQKDLKEINRIAMVSPPIPKLTMDGNKVIWKAVDVRSVLSMLCRDFIDLVTGPLSIHVKLCANPECRGIFVDESRPKNRRWCSMQTCGNQMKKSRIGKKLSKQCLAVPETNG